VGFVSKVSEDWKGAGSRSSSATISFETTSIKEPEGCFWILVDLRCTGTTSSVYTI
jgi:hypothetical protein